MSRSFDPTWVPQDGWKMLGSALRAQGFSSALIDETERILPARHDALRLPLVHRMLRLGANARSLLARLFVYDDAVDARAASEALGAELFALLLERQGLIASEEGVRAAFRVTPLFDSLIASDRTTGRNPVIPPGPTTYQLARCLPLDLAGSTVLDLGCGPGSLAILAAQRGATSVVATDIDARALAYSLANAAMADVSLELLEGDGSAPVRGRQFDIVVCQPPFVPQPPEISHATYLHGGERGDELAWRMLSDLPKLLTPQGIALVRIDLPGPPAETHARLSALGMSSIAFAARGPSSDELAMAYAMSAHDTLAGVVAAEAIAYADHFARHDIARVSSVLLVAWNDPTPRQTLRQLPSLYTIDAEKIAVLRAGIEASASAALLDRQAAPPRGARLKISTSLDTHERVYTVEIPGEHPFEISEPVALLVDVLSQGATLGEAADALVRATDAPEQQALEATLGFARDALAAGILVLR